MRSGRGENLKGFVEQSVVSSTLGQIFEWDIFTNLRNAHGALVQAECPEVVNQIHYNNIISIMGRCKQFGAAVQVFEELQQESTEFEQSNRSVQSSEGEGERGARFHLAPDVMTYTALISACATAGKWRDATDYFVHMKERGSVQPNR
jgi:pentatricopeptide repeat protein